MIIICGCGGTGSNLAPMLSRMLKNEIFYLIDGDTVEGKNIERQTFQNFDIGSNKARALSKKLNSNFPNKHYFLDKYLESAEEIKQLLVDKSTGKDIEFISRIIIIGCVDNNASRKILEDAYTQIKKKFAKKKLQVHYIDSGNEDNFGTVLVDYLRSNFMDLNTNDHPTTHCCNEIATGNLQQYQINLDMALAIAKVVFSIVEGKEVPTCIKIDGFNRSVE